MWKEQEVDLMVNPVVEGFGCSAFHRRAGRQDAK